MNFVKDYIKRYATKGLDVTDYVPIGISKNTASATLTSGQTVINVTHRHFTFAYNPIVIGIALPSEVGGSLAPKATLCFYNASQKLLCALDLIYVRSSSLEEFKGSVLFLFHIGNCALHQLNWLRRTLILWVRYLHNRKSKKYFGTLPFSLHKQYAAVFTFPRKVALVTVRARGFNRSFPIDLQGTIGNDILMLGLRHSNEAVSHLKNGASLVISSVSHEDYKLIYALGKFKNVDSDAISYQLVKTRKLGIEIPAFVLDYLEIEIFSQEDVGSQCLFFGRIVHKELIRDSPALHHVHLIEYLEDYLSPSRPLPHRTSSGIDL